MTDDVRIATGLRTHRKTKRLKRLLGKEGCWSLMCLFMWAGAERWTGDLAGLSDADIEEEADWDGDAGALIAALVEVKFLVGEQGARRIHDWAEHNPYAATKGQRIEQGKVAANARWGKKKDTDGNAGGMPPASGEHGSGIEGQCPPAPAPAPTSAVATTPTTPESALRSGSEVARAVDALRAEGCPDVTATDPHLVKALTDGITTAELVDRAKSKSGRGKGIAYLCQAARGKRADAAGAGAPAGRPEPPRNPEGPSPRLSKAEEKRREAEALRLMREQHEDLGMPH